jgi:hypothetical protein
MIADLKEINEKISNQEINYNEKEIKNNIKAVFVIFINQGLILGNVKW